MRRGSEWLVPLEIVFSVSRLECSNQTSFWQISDAILLFHRFGLGTKNQTIYQTFELIIESGKEFESICSAYLKGSNSDLSQ